MEHPTSRPASFFSLNDGEPMTAPTTPTHHLTEALLFAYAAGQLPEAFNLVVATHLSLCPACRRQADAFDALGGAVLDRCLPVPMEARALDWAMARMGQDIAGPHRVNGTGHVDATPPLFPACLRDYVGGDLAAVRWRPVGMGVRQAILPTARPATARLLFIPAGAAMPDHGHRGQELTLVLKGAFTDGDDRFGVGDVEVADEATQHTPRAEAAGDCICLAATDAPLRFNGLLARLAQPFFGI